MRLEIVRSNTAEYQNRIMNEIWVKCRVRKSIEPGYLLSSLGRVWSLKRDCLLQPFKVSQNGRNKYYMSVTLSGENYRVAYLVMWSFDGLKPDPSMHVCHFDDDQSNNARENLYYGTAEQNRLDAIFNRNPEMVTRWTYGLGEQLYNSESGIWQAASTNEECEQAWRRHDGSMGR